MSKTVSKISSKFPNTRQSDYSFSSTHWTPSSTLYSSPAGNRCLPLMGWIVFASKPNFWCTIIFDFIWFQGFIFCRVPFNRYLRFYRWQSIRLWKTDARAKWAIRRFFSIKSFNRFSMYLNEASIRDCNSAPDIWSITYLGTKKSGNIRTWYFQW